MYFILNNVKDVKILNRIYLANYFDGYCDLYKFVNYDKFYDNIKFFHIEMSDVKLSNAIMNGENDKENLKKFLVKSMLNSYFTKINHKNKSDVEFLKFCYCDYLNNNNILLDFAKQYYREFSLAKYFDLYSKNKNNKFIKRYGIISEANLKENINMFILTMKFYGVEYVIVRENSLDHLILKSLYDLKNSMIDFINTYSESMTEKDYQFVRNFLLGKIPTQYMNFYKTYGDSFKPYNYYYSFKNQYFYSKKNPDLKDMFGIDFNSDIKSVFLYLIIKNNIVSHLILNRNILIKRGHKQ